MAGAEAEQRVHLLLDGMRSSAPFFLEASRAIESHNGGSKPFCRPKRPTPVLDSMSGSAGEISLLVLLPIP